MRGVEQLLAGYRRFRRERYAQQQQLFLELADSQSPQIMIIACADSRVAPSMVFSASPGELFVYRNVANLVPRFDENHPSIDMAAALEFAILGLKVDDIVVMGHANCGGINACLNQGDGSKQGQYIAPWVEQLGELRSLVVAQNQGADPKQLRRCMEQAAIGQSIRNIASYPFAKTAIAQGEIRLHGAWFSIASGELSWRDEESGSFHPVASEDAEIADQG